MSPKVRRQPRTLRECRHLEQGSAHEEEPDSRRHVPRVRPRGEHLSMSFVSVLSMYHCVMSIIIASQFMKCFVETRQAFLRSDMV